MKVLLMTSYAGLGFNNSPPVGLYRLKYCLNENDIECEVIDQTISDLNEYLQKAAEGEFTIIGMSVSHNHMKEDVIAISKFRKACENSKCLFIAGGQEATYNYEKWLKAGVDVVFTGYAEKALCEVALLLKDDFNIGISRLREIDGVAFSCNGKYVFNPCLAISKSEFEYLTYEQVMKLNVPYEIYWNIARAESDGLSFSKSLFIPETVRMYTSSHCPNHCGYCSSHGFLSFSEQKKAPIHMLDAKLVCKMIIEHVKKYAAKGFLFSDDEFLMNRKRSMRFCEYIIKAKKEGIIPESITFNCQARVVDFLLGKDEVKTVNHELIEILKESGFHSISLGVESFSQRQLHSPSMNKRGYTEKDIFRIIDYMLECSLVPQVNIILFVPESTKDEIIYAMKNGMMIAQKGCTLAVTPHLLTIPGAPIYDDKRYPRKAETFISPITNESIDIPEYFIPFDSEIEDIAMLYSDAHANEIQAFEKSNVWNKKKVNKTFLGMLSFVTVAKLMGMNDLANEWSGIIRDLAVRARAKIT